MQALKNLTSLQASLASATVLVVVAASAAGLHGVIQRGVASSVLEDAGYKPISIVHRQGLLLATVEPSQVGGQPQSIWLTEDSTRFVAGQVVEVANLPRGQIRGIEQIDPLAAPVRPEVSDANPAVAPALTDVAAADALEATAEREPLPKVSVDDFKQALAEVVAKDLQPDRYAGLLDPTIRPTPASYSPPRVKNYKELVAATTGDGVLTMGAKGKELTVFVDPFCPYSVKLVERLKPAVEAGKIQVRLIPIAAAGGRQAHAFGAIIASLGKWKSPDEVTEDEVNALSVEQIHNTGFAVARNTMVAGELMADQIVTPAIIVATGDKPIELYRGSGDLAKIIAGK